MQGSLTRGVRVCMFFPFYFIRLRAGGSLVDLHGMGGKQSAAGPEGALSKSSNIYSRMVGFKPAEGTDLGVLLPLPSHI